jgi:23S rRNA pseudouridine1911/1915/1917 synthase
VDVLFVDNHLLAVNKPAGMVTQGDLDVRCREWLRRKYRKEGAVFLEPVHRLDKPASGIVLCARTSKALSRLQEMMRRRAFLKVYHAGVERDPPCAEGTLEHWLTHDAFRARIVQAGEGKKAVLHYRLLAPRLLEVTLETGRYHQIRAQLAAVGCPIVGDRTYGGARPYEREGIALCHVRLAFTHPVTRLPVDIQLDRNSSVLRN